MSPDGEPPAEQVEVVAERMVGPAETLPMPYTIVDLSPLDPGGPGLGLQEALVATPGVLARNRFNSAQGPRISIRGFGARSAFGVRGIGVVLDGVPLTLADGLAQLDGVDPDLLGRIEVLRGPAAALYGNAAGGVLVLHSADAGERPGAYALVQGGGFGLVRGVARVAVGETVAAASYTRAAGYREHSAYERWIGHLATSHTLGERGRLSVGVQLLDVPRSEDPGALVLEELATSERSAAPDNVTFDAGEEIRQLQSGARLVVAVTPFERVDASVYAVTRNFLGRVPFRVNELSRDAFGVHTALRSTRVGGPFEIDGQLAFDAARLADRRLTFDNEGGHPVGAPTVHQDEGVVTAGAYVQGRVTAWERFTTYGTVRYDRSLYTVTDRSLDDGDGSDARTFRPVTGLAGISWVALDGVVGYLSWAQAYEAPTISELSVRPDGEAGFVDDLNPQRASTVNWGVRVRRGPVLGELGTFYTALTDELVPFSDDTGRTFYRNAGQSSRLGAEAALDVTVGRAVALRGAWTGIDARYDNSKHVPGIPPHHVGLSVLRQPAAGWVARVDTSWLAATWVDDANTVRAPGQATVDVRAGWRGSWRRLDWELRAGVENLLNSQTIDNVRPNASNGRYFEPGWPRFVYVGWSTGLTPDP